MNPEFFIGKPIQSLQAMLRAISNWNDAVTGPVPDGIYGKETHNSVSAFQTAYGLPANGIADLETWEKIVEVYEDIILELNPPNPLIFSYQPGQIILPNESNAHMHAINGMLIALSIYYPTMPVSLPGGTHTSSSLEAVQWLQTRADLPASGNIDRKTWRALSDLYRTTLGDGTATAAFSSCE